jgi:hypothetical protein
MVLAETVGNCGSAATQRASSLRLQRASGIACVCGKLQATAVACARTSGGKTPWRSFAGRVGQGMRGYPTLTPLAD